LKEDNIHKGEFVGRVVDEMKEKYIGVRKCLGKEWGK
jgi:hypothetical protein